MNSLLYKIKKNFSNRAAGSFILFNVVLVIVFVFFYNSGVNKIVSKSIEQLHNRQELAVSSGAKSIRLFLDMAKNSLLLLSQNLSATNSRDFQDALNDFAQDWSQTPVKGVVLFDKSGKLVSIASNAGSTASENTDFSDREYFGWAKAASEGDTYLGKPIVPRVNSPEPEYILPFVTPVYRNGEFDGGLIMAISLNKLISTYMEPLKFTPKSISYFIHPDGTILAGPLERIELVGVNYFEYLKKKSYEGSQFAYEQFAKAVRSEKSGKLDLILFSLDEQKPIRYLISYSPLTFGDQHWIISLATPYDSLYTDLGSLRETGIMMFSAIVFFILTLSIIGILLSKSNQNQGSTPSANQQNT